MTRGDRSIPAFVFANVTSLPLLLLATMSKQEAFARVLVPSGEDMESVVSRGRIFILLNALFSHVTRFTLGPCKSHSFLAWPQSLTHTAS